MLLKKLNLTQHKQTSRSRISYIRAVEQFSSRSPTVLKSMQEAKVCTPAPRNTLFRYRFRHNTIYPGSQCTNF